MSDTTIADAEAILAAEAERAAVQRAHEIAARTLESMGQAQPPMSPAAARIGDEPLTFITVAKSFKMNIDHHRIVEFPVGSYVCPVRLADNWWAQANGIIVQDLATIRDSVPLDALSKEERAAILRLRAEKAAAVARAALADLEAAEAEPGDDAAKEPVETEGKGRRGSKA